MAQFSRQKYKSRREKYQVISRNTRLILIFLLIAGAILLFKNRWGFWIWLKDGLGI